MSSQNKVVSGANAPLNSNFNSRDMCGDPLAPASGHAGKDDHSGTGLLKK